MGRRVREGQGREVERDQRVMEGVRMIREMANRESRRKV